MPFRICVAVLATAVVLSTFPSVEARAQARETGLTVTDGVDSINLRVGLDPTASDGIDAGLGEAELPPFPPSGVFEARWIDSDIPSTGLGEGSYVDFRTGDATSAAVIVHELRYQRGSGSFIKLIFALPANVSITVDDLFGGVIVHAELSGSGDYTVANPIVDKLKLTISYPAATTVNRPPAAAGDAYLTAENTPLVVAAGSGVLANDSDPDGDALTAVVVSTVSHGSLTLNADGSFTYTPTANYSGPDGFTYRASDGALDSPSTSVSIIVTGANTGLVALDGTLTTSKNTAGDVTLVASGMAGSVLTYSVASPPSHGGVTIAGNRATYTPITGYAGGDSFTFIASDGSLTSNVATITVRVTEAVVLPASAPLLLSPADATVFVLAQTAEFSWSEVSGATTYEWEDNGTVSDRGAGLSFSYSFPGEESIGLHTWRVRGRNGAGVGPWSQSRTFTVVREVASEPETGDLPQRFALHQNYPNPFNPRTSIAFDVPQHSHVRLTVYDLLGHEVRVLVNREMTAGSHSAQFDGSALPSGTYVYLLETGTVRFSRMLTMVK